MSTLIDHLRSFNRKERFILLREALGEQTFHLAQGFRARLSETIDTAIPVDAFVAMDYHLDWIQMALYLTATPAPQWPAPNSGMVEGNQQDVDLLVAFDEGDAQTHLILLEAKAETGWTNKQMDEKARRLRRIFGDGPGIGFVTPHFVLVSPRRPRRLRSHDWPDWMTVDREPRWMNLQLPARLSKVTRCDVDGRAAASGGYLRVGS